jgi:AbrB family looped-hinge helix DNA binding protein
MTIATISEKGQLVIPAAMRKMLGISAGTRIELTLERDGFRAYVRPARKTRTAKTCLGLTNYHGPRIDVSEMNAELLTKRP